MKHMVPHKHKEPRTEEVLVQPRGTATARQLSRAQIGSSTSSNPTRLAGPWPSRDLSTTNDPELTPSSYRPRFLFYFTLLSSLLICEKPCCGPVWSKPRTMIDCRPTFSISGSADEYRPGSRSRMGPGQTGQRVSTGGYVPLSYI
jgi:hypothetical protein